MMMMMRMMEKLSEYASTWENISVNSSDPRVNGWFMMESPVPSAIICLAYVIFVLLGPTIMKTREPFKINELLIAYNFAMIVLSGYLLYEFIANGWWNDYSFGCQPVDYSNSPKALRMARVCWLFYISKFIELLDTVFFIMRKKFNQVSFLHVFHHGIMPVSWWFGVKFVPGGFGTFHSMINSFIHFLMYFYYFLSTFGPRFQKYLWWKKYMTSLQLIQFAAVMLHSAQLLFIECHYPVLFVYWIGSYAIIFMVFFANFYHKNYTPQSQIKPKSRQTMPATRKNE